VVFPLVRAVVAVDVSVRKVLEEEYLAKLGPVLLSAQKNWLMGVQKQITRPQKESRLLYLPDIETPEAQNYLGDGSASAGRASVGGQGGEKVNGRLGMSLLLSMLKSILEAEADFCAGWLGWGESGWKRKEGLGREGLGREGVSTGRAGVGGEGACFFRGFWLSCTPGSRSSRMASKKRCTRSPCHHDPPTSGHQRCEGGGRERGRGRGRGRGWGRGLGRGRGGGGCVEKSAE
jgi:hypothetical protein